MMPLSSEAPLIAGRAPASSPAPSAEGAHSKKPAAREPGSRSSPEAVFRGPDLGLVCLQGYAEKMSVVQATQSALFFHRAAQTD